MSFEERYFTLHKHWYIFEMNANNYDVATVLRLSAIVA